MMINELKQQKSRAWSRRWWQAAFSLLLTVVITAEAVPELSANALYLITDGISTVVTGGTERVDASRILVTSTKSSGTDVALEAGKKVTILHNGGMQYATSRGDETVSALLQREGVKVGPLEIVRVSTAGGGITLDIAADFTYYETESESTNYSTTYTTDYRIPKGQQKVTTAGKAGTHKTTYEIVYADGAFVSRQAIAESTSPAVTEVVSKGTLVKSAASGDKIAKVIRENDGSGYLIMKSGDSLHFKRTMEVKCTAYTAGHGGVGTKTYTGTTVHVGCVAVDKSVIPLGTRMFITTKNGSYTYGMAKAEDTGVRGKTVDLYMNTYKECINFGVRSSIVYILD